MEYVRAHQGMETHVVPKSIPNTKRFFCLTLMEPIVVAKALSDPERPASVENSRKMDERPGGGPGLFSEARVRMKAF
jgi:hypothetical protein